MLSGLECLADLHQLSAYPRSEPFEGVDCYIVENSSGQELFLAVGTSDFLTRSCCGTFDVKILEPRTKREIIHLCRNLACRSCCLPVCLQKLEVSSPPGTFLGNIRQKFNFFRTSFIVEDLNCQTIFQIEKSGSMFYIFKGTEILGEINKNSNGFRVTFPATLEIPDKILLLGALFMIDFMYFETVSEQE